MRRRRRGTGTRAKFVRAEWKGNKTEEQGARNGAWILRFPRIPLIYILSWRRKEGKERKGSRWEKKRAAASGRRASERERSRRERRPRGGGRAISAVCMRGRRQTLLNCPMTPYIPFYPVRPPAHTLLRFRPAAASPRVVIPIPKKTDPASPRAAREETTRRGEHSNWDSPPRTRANHPGSRF